MNRPEESRLTIIRTARMVQDAAQAVPEFFKWLMDGISADIDSVDDQWYREAVDMDAVNQLRGQKAAFMKIKEKIEREVNRDLVEENRKLEALKTLGGRT